MMSPRLFPDWGADHFAFLLLLVLQFLCPCAALVRLNSKPFSFTFLDAPARFGVPVDADGICGSLHVADPIEACTPLSNADPGRGAVNRAGRRLLLISRGNCNFEEKVRHAQQGGFDAAIVFDDQEKAGLYSMIGDSMGIHIPAVFVSKMAGENLKKFARGEDGECCINSSLDDTAGTVLVMSFVSLVVIISVLASFLFARNCRLLRHRVNGRSLYMKRQEVEKLPCLEYSSACANCKHFQEACSICLEDYKDGDMIRVLPCKHEFHMVCVDPWLTEWGTFCPVCKLELCSDE